MRLAAGLLAASALWALPATAAAEAAGRLVFKDYSAPLPPTWQPLAVTSSYRVAQYRVPAAFGASDGEVVVYYFGAGQGGSLAANVARWASQFSGPDGQPVQPKVETLRIDGLAATVVELRGTYARQIGTSAGVAGRPGQTLLAAVVETPHGNLTFQLHGDQATVAAHRPALLDLVQGLRQR